MCNNLIYVIIEPTIAPFLIPGNCPTQKLASLLDIHTMVHDIPGICTAFKWWLSVLLELQTSLARNKIISHPHLLLRFLSQHAVMHSNNVNSADG